jgi:hypothetical protein
VGGWVSFSRSVPTCWLEVTAWLSMMRQAAGVVDFCWHGAEADVDGIGKDVHHALRENDVVCQSHRVA